MGLSLLAVMGDSLAVLGGLALAAWIRFESGWLPWVHNPPADLMSVYTRFGAMVTLVALLILRNQGLFVRPQTGAFVNKIPRLIKAGVLWLLASMVVAFAVQNEMDISRPVLVVACVTVTAFLVLERYILYRVEWNLARHSRRRHKVLILGTDSVAARLKRTFGREHMLRARVVGFIRAEPGETAPAIPPEEILGDLDNIEAIITREGVNQLILARWGLSQARVIDIMMLCERHLVTFNMVPDLLHLMTSSMDVQALDDIPLLGISPWPLDFVWNRFLKRIEDMAGAAAGLILAAPVMAVAAVAIKLNSPGPVFYSQERCGKNGRAFKMYKLRTMRLDAEKATGPVFTAVDDARRTRVGAFLRQHNLDELPQLWHVLRGEMSLVGPRPERPHFVDQFKTEVARYLWRHVSKPGMTGWAQINGLRGDTSIDDRVKYDLYYLENWSLSFDFKVLVKTLFARENAY